MDYQLNRWEKISFALITKCIGVDLALKNFLPEKSGGRGECFKGLRRIFHIEMKCEK